MLFGVNLTQLRPFAMGGMETYARRLIENLGTVGRPDRFLLFIDRRRQDSLPALRYANVEYIPLDTADHLDRGDIGPWLKNEFESSSVEAMLFPLNLVFPMNLDLPMVVTMFDIQHEYFPEFFSAEELASRKARFRPSAEKADIVLTISEFCRQQLIEKFALPASKIRVTYLAAGTQFTPQSPHDISRLRHEYDLPDSYLYYPAGAWPHKNHRFLFAVIEALWTSGRRVELVLSTYLSDATDKLKSLAEEEGMQPGQVRFLDVLPERKLPALYAAATALVFPSLYEGFGIPIVEAMSCGCPVVSSPCGALSEVGGDAPLLVETKDVGAWVSAVESVIDSDGLRTRLVRAGLERAKRFSWQDCVRSAVQALRDVALARTMSKSVPNVLRSYQRDFVEQELTPGDVAGRRVLEIGCGEGQIVRFLAARRDPPETLVGVDLLIEEEQGKGYVFKRTDARSLPFPEESFHLVYSIAVLEHVDDLAELLAEVARVLKPGGRFISVANPIWTGFRGHHYGPELTLPGLQDIELPWAHRLLKDETFERYLVTGEGFSISEAASARRWVFESPDLNRLGLSDYERAFAASPLRVTRFDGTEAVLEGENGLRARFSRQQVRSGGLLAPDALDRFLLQNAAESPLVYKFTVTCLKEKPEESVDRDGRNHA